MNLNRRLIHETGGARDDLAVTILSSGFMGVLIVLQAFVLSAIVDGVFLKGWDLDDSSLWLVGFVALSVLRAVILYLKENSAQAVASKTKLQLRERLLDRITRMGPYPIGLESSGALSSVINQGIETLDAYYRRYVPQLVIAGLVPLTILLFIFPIDTLSALILLFTAPLIPFFMILIGDTTEKITQRQWTTLSRLSAAFQDTLQGLKTLKVLGRSDERAVMLGESAEEYRQATMGVLRVGFLSALVLELLATLSSAIIAVEIGLRLLTGRIDFQQGLFILFLAPEFYFPLRLLSSYFHAGTAGTAAASDIYELIDREPTQRTGLALCLREDPPGIRFQEISYRYPIRRAPELNTTKFPPGNHPATLKEVSFELPAGRTTALVGPSGCGKSTLSSLILRFIEPDSGTIEVDGIPYQEYDLQKWRSQIAWVPQTPTLFQGSVRDNILLGDRNASEEALIDAAERSLSHEFIREFPDGYDTLIGERGLRLSGGQRVRIALARAFLKGAPLFILDEVTADLDPEAEERLLDSIREYCRDRTALLIAHRLGTISHADQILVLSRGHIIEQGTHIQLLREEGLYAQLIGAYHSTLAEVEHGTC
jgi:thiol reductant ABC exporter CydD subunit